MPIEFHCPKCGKLIRAPGSAGGRRGTCPYCKESVYIPTPPEEIEEIPLAPIDEADEVRERRLLDEARRLATAIDREQPAKYDTDEAPRGADSVMPMPRDFEDDVGELISEYLSAMAASDMARADTATRQLNSQAARAREHVRRLMADERPPPDLGDIPEPVYRGLLRSLLELL